MCSICHPAKMKYRRLSSDDILDKDKNSKEATQMFNFYMNHGYETAYTRLLLNESVTAKECCDLLAVKTSGNKGFELTIYEHSQKMYSERLVEDHEILMDVHKNQLFLKPEKFMFIYKNDMDKYHYIKKRQKYFIHPNALAGVNPSKLKCDPKYIQIKDLFLTDPGYDLHAESPTSSSEDQAKKTYLDEYHNPIFCGTIYVKTDITISFKKKFFFPNKSKFAVSKWCEQYLLLRNRTLYIINSFKEMMKLYYRSDEDFESIIASKNFFSKIRRLGSVLDMDIYSHLHIKRMMKDAPYGSGIVIRKFVHKENQYHTLVFCMKQSETPNFLRQQWLAAFRMAKHGRKLIENFRIYEQEVKADCIRTELLKCAYLKQATADALEKDNARQLTARENQKIDNIVSRFMQVYNEKNNSESGIQSDESGAASSLKTDKAPHANALEAVMDFFSKYKEEDFLHDHELPEPEEDLTDTEGNLQDPSTSRKKIVDIPGSTYAERVMGLQQKISNYTIIQKLKRVFELEKRRRDQLLAIAQEEANNPRVAMDFTNGVGRVVSDPEEVAQIYKHERWGAQYRPTRFIDVRGGPTEILKYGPHLTQGYFHGDSITRDEAETLVLNNGKDGAFLVRKSINRPGWLVITYVFSHRAHHQYIRPVILPDEDNKGGIYLATCDKETVFYDVHSLIEFYRLNKGPLQTHLSESVKNLNQPNRTPPRERRPFASPLDFPPWCNKSQSSSSQAGTSKPSTSKPSTSKASSSHLPLSPASSQDPQSSSSLSAPTASTSSGDSRSSNGEAQTQSAKNQTQGDERSPEI
ncbi:uncharacterized protein LOC143192959 isoform X2 [Rhynchophorus ferrugineus]|uniref:uncharacterized protein LOC143192959 isoform X2 n=1 Tax=Rhynchophorus ferrugineus TaxID=354439 RepID=UPI003FCC8E3A